MQWRCPEMRWRQDCRAGLLCPSSTAAPCSMEATLADMRSVIAREEATCDPAVLAAIKREWAERVRGGAQHGEG